MPVPLDEYPIHQSPLSMRYVETSDRNAYDRCYFNAHDRTGDLFLITGLGIYPNLGVIDAYATLRTRRPPALGADVGRAGRRAAEPARRSVPDRGHRAAREDPAGLRGERARARLRPDVGRIVPRGRGAAPRLAPGWSDHARRLPLRAGRHLDRGDRGRGQEDLGDARTVGSGRATGRGGSARWARRSRRHGAAEEPIDGFWWTYIPLRFEDYAIVIILQEEPDGHRVMNEAVRVWPGADRSPEQLGWPQIDIHYESGTRHPVGATVQLQERGGKPLTLEVETLGYTALNCGAGYGGDPDWGHGQWKGRELDRGRGLRHDRPRDPRAGPVRRRGPRGAAPRSTARRASASSSTRRSAATTRPTSPAGSPSPPDPGRRSAVSCGGGRGRGASCRGGARPGGRARARRGRSSGSARSRHRSARTIG